MDRPFFGFHGFRILPACLGLLVIVLVAARPAESFAQDNDAIYRAQAAVRERIMREQGGGSSSVTFDSNRRTETYRVSGNQTGVRGEGVFRRDFNASSQRFTYDAVVNTRSGRVQPINYNFVGGGDGGYDDNDSAVPRWLVGTFRGRSPSGRQSELMSLTVGRAGDVSAVYDNGSRESGRYFNGQIQLGGRTAWDVTRMGNGFRATSRRRSEDFVRTSDDDDRDDSGRVPRWVIGTFRGMTDSGESELTIGSDGAATIRSLKTNRTFYGRYADRTLRFDWGTFDVERLRDGLRTINVNDRSNTSDYQRVRGY